MTAKEMAMTVVGWVMGLTLAVLTGWVQILFNDLHLALLAAMGFGLCLALLFPRHPWRWGLLIGLAPAAAEFYLIARGEPVQRGTVEAAFGAILPATVGCLGGYAMRKMVGRVFEKPPEEFTNRTIARSNDRTN